MIVEEVSVMNQLGLHARPAATLVQTTLQFKCEVYIEMEGRRVNAKSIMGLLTLAAAQGTRLKVYCDGDDAEAAVDAIRELFESGFGEH
jgi:phosphocarrier protein HPr